MKIAVLISGNGSNLQALLENDKKKNITLVSSNKKALGLQHAIAWNIPYFIQKNESEMLQILKDYHIDMIFLAGFMRILSDNFVNQFPNRIINIHPSLLPKYKGMHTHKRALANHEQIHGCTCHIVTPNLDDGPIIGQAIVPVFTNDVEEILAKRVLQQEHKIYPMVFQKIVEGKLDSLKKKPLILSTI